MTASPVFDHVAFAVPNLDEQVERLTRAFGMVVQFRSGHYAVVVDSRSDFELELSASHDAEIHLRHLGFRADDVDAAHAGLVAAGMETSEAPIGGTSPACTRRISSSPAASKCNW